MLKVIIYCNNLKTKAMNRAASLICSSMCCIILYVVQICINNLIVTDIRIYQLSHSTDDHVWCPTLALNQAECVRMEGCPRLCSASKMSAVLLRK